MTQPISDEYDKFGIERLSHHPNSPDLASCDFWLFGYLKHRIDGRFFDDNIALKGALSDILMSIEPDIFASMFAEWKHRLLKYVDQGSDYR
jgi:hypothetical protein